MEKEGPTVIVMGGPNGAGKSTISTKLFPQALGVYHYVNADTLARGLSAFHFDEMALKAGKVMLQHLHDLAGEGELRLRDDPGEQDIRPHDP